MHIKSIVSGAAAVFFAYANAQYPHFSGFDNAPIQMTKALAAQTDVLHLLNRTVIYTDMIGPDRWAKDPIISKYFKPDEYSIVHDVLHSMNGENGLGSLWFDFAEIAYWYGIGQGADSGVFVCQQAKNSHQPTDVNIVKMPQSSDDHYILHPCEENGAFGYKSLLDLTLLDNSCPNMDNKLRDIYMTFAGNLLHAYLGYEKLTNDGDLKDIYNPGVKNAVGLPQTTPAELRIAWNKWSYVWYATEVYLSEVCGKNFDGVA